MTFGYVTSRSLQLLPGIEIEMCESLVHESPSPKAVASNKVRGLSAVKREREKDERLRAEAEKISGLELHLVINLN